jgi:hypothetical protein
MEFIRVPVMQEGNCKAGKRVRQCASEYSGTEVYHSLYLPEDCFTLIQTNGHFLIINTVIS